MKSNYDRSKTIVRKTTKNYHPRADNLLLLIICRKKRLKAIDWLCTEILPYPGDWSIIFVVYPWKSQNWLSTGDGFFPSLPAYMLVWPWWRYRSSSGQRRYHTKLRFFSSSGQAIARKMLKKGWKKKSIIILHCVFKEYIFIVATPKITAKPGEKLQCSGSWSRGRVGARRNCLWRILA